MHVLTRLIVLPCTLALLVTQYLRLLVTQCLTLFSIALQAER